MRPTSMIKENLKRFFLLSILLLLLIFQDKFTMVKALPMDNYKSSLVIEELRLSIPFEFKDVWLEAEKNIWEPWLSKQDGFLGRQIFWNAENEEGLILVNWENKELWKSISINELNLVQDKFEENVKRSLNLNENPFKLIFEGEIYKQV